MTLFIACLLIYGFDLSGWLYVAATALWLAHLWWAMMGFSR